MAVNEKEFEEMKALVMNQGQQLNELIGWIKANKEPAPAAVITQEPKEEKKDEVPEWFKAYVAANPPAVVPTQKEEKVDKPKKNWKETAKDVAAVAGVGALALFGITKVFNAGQTYEQHQQNLKLLQSNDPYGGTIETTTAELDLTK